MGTLRIEVFCTTAEAWRWISEACEKADHVCLLFRTLAEDGAVWTPAEPIPGGPFYGAFLYPSGEAVQGLRWSDLGLTRQRVEVRRGFHKTDDVLLETEFLMEKARRRKRRGTFCGSESTLKPWLEWTPSTS